MTSPRLHGHTGGNMAGTNTYSVKIEFFVYADDDDTALHKVTRTLRYEDDIVWAWKDTQLINKGEASE